MSKNWLILRTAKKSVLEEFLKKYSQKSKFYILEFSDNSIAKSLEGIEKVIFINSKEVSSRIIGEAIREISKINFDYIVCLVNKGKEDLYGNVFEFLEKAFNGRDYYVYVEGKGMVKSKRLYHIISIKRRILRMSKNAFSVFCNSFLDMFEYVFGYFKLYLNGFLARFKRKKYDFDNKRVLLVVNRFPPLFHGGNVRWIKFIKYLYPKAVFSVLTSETVRKDYDRQNSMLDELPENVDVERVFYKERDYRKIFGVIPMIDEYHIWSLKAFKRAVDICIKNLCGTVVVSVPLFSPLIIGYYLKKFLGLRFIVDMRDEWTISELPSFRRLDTPYNKKWEKKIFECADFVFVTTEKQRRNYLEKYPYLQNKLAVAENGCDFDDGKFLEGVNVISEKEIINIDFFGTINDDRVTDTIVNTFNKMKILFDDGKRVKIRFFGRNDVKLREFFDGKSLCFCGYVDRKRMFEIIRNESDVLLTMASPYSSAYVAGKSYEMLLSGKPIIAIVPDGEAKNLFRRFEGVFIANPNSEKQIFEAFTDALKFYSYKRICDRKKFLENYYHKNIVEKSYEKVLL